MKIEHIACQVEEPDKMARWYCKHLGFIVKRSADAPVPVRFIADDTEQVMLEIYNNPKVTTPDYAAMDPLLLHIAFSSRDVQGDADRLVAAGASLVSGPELLPSGDEMAMLRDPWNLAIQLCKRSTPMI